MRRFLILVMLCLLPLQVSWAAVSDYCGHEQEKAAQHFGHHDHDHKAFPEKSDADKQPGKLNFGHDHCHLSGFLGLLSELVVQTSLPPTQPALRGDERIYASPALDRLERPNWHTLA
mgnify:CR=1 FL=1